jgi:hypothetical protein
MKKLIGIANVTNHHVYRSETDGETTLLRRQALKVAMQQSSSSFLKNFISFIVYLTALSAVQMIQLPMTGLIMHD